MSKPTPTDAGGLPPLPTRCPPPTRGARGRRHGRVPVLALTFMINAADRQVFAPLLPTIREEYGFSLQAGGLLATIFTLGMAVAGIPAGYLVDRFSRKTVLIVSIVVYSLGTLATPLATGWGDMAVYRIISGLGEGMQAAALFAAVGAFFHLRRGLALGALGVAFGLGVILGPLVGGRFRGRLRLLARPVHHLRPHRSGRRGDRAFAVSRQFTERGAGSAAAIAGLRLHAGHPVQPQLLALAVASVFGCVVLYGFLGLYPTFLTTQLEVSTGETALALSFVGFGGLFGLIGGWIGDRVDQATC